MSRSEAGRSGVGDPGANPNPVQISSTLPSIERLSGRENWATWKFAVETFLELEDLWEAVKPIANPDGTFPDVDARKDRKARAKIILLLDPVNYVHVKDAKTARETWAKLEAAFEDTGLTRRVGLLRKLISTTLDSCNSVDTYVTQIVSTAHQLRGVGFEISEEWVGTLLLAGLPEEYKPMIMARESSGTAITGDSIKTKLLQEVQTTTDKTAFIGRRAHRRESSKAQPTGQLSNQKVPGASAAGSLATSLKIAR